jgi:DNA-binding response OmpR family regulator
MAYILIVDDDEDFASAVAMTLHDAGYEVGVQSTPESGLRSIGARRPDLAILDVMFPENDTAGFDLARAIRKNFGALPAIMLTAVNQKFPMGFSSGDIDDTWLPVLDFIEKPVDLDALRGKVDQLIARAKLAPLAS